MAGLSHRVAGQIRLLQANRPFAPLEYLLTARKRPPMMKHRGKLIGPYPWIVKALQ